MRSAASGPLPPGNGVKIRTGRLGKIVCARPGTSSPGTSAAAPNIPNALMVLRRAFMANPPTQKWLGSETSRFELGKLGYGTPHAERRVAVGKLPWLVRGFLVRRDHANAARVFEDHSVGPFEIEKRRARSGVAPRTEHDPDSPLAQE